LWIRFLDFGSSQINRLRTAASNDPNLHVWDANLCGAHDFTASEAYDALHLSGAGATRLTKQLRNSLIAWGVPTQ